MNFDYQEQEQVTDQDDSFTGAGGSENQQQQVEEEKKKIIEKPLPTSNNKLIIKLKPDPMATHDNDDGVVSADRSSSMNISRNPASCKHCRKEFSSGKALGAHMRIHPNHNNENRSLSAGMSRFRGIGSKSYLDDLLKDGKPTCSICGKSFISAKSLFGHMRCHPDRNWRGMQPPQQPSDEPDAPSSPCSELFSSSGGPRHIASSAYSSHHDQNYKLVTDLEQCSPGWSVKDKRGRKSSIAKMSRCDNDYDDDDDEMISNAVHGLMMLQAASNKHHQHHPGEIGDGDSLICKYCTNQSEKLDVAKNGIRESRFGDDDPQLVLKSTKSYYDCGDESDINGSDYNQEEMRKMKVRRTINLKDIECSSNDHMDCKMTPPPGAAAASERCYKCATCDKLFASPQALGGHRSSTHNEIFTRNTSNPQVLVKDSVFESNCGGRGLEEWDRLDEDKSTAREVVHPPPPLQPHVCRTCEKAFPSGQALGGHQRCHWQGPPSSSSSSSPAAAGQQLMNMMCDDQSGSPSAAASTKKAEAFDFDLNEFPANDHEEEESR